MKTIFQWYILYNAKCSIVIHNFVHLILYNSSLKLTFRSDNVISRSRMIFISLISFDNSSTLCARSSVPFESLLRKITPTTYNVTNDASINTTICWPEDKDKNAAIIWLKTKFVDALTAATSTVSPETIDALVVSLLSSDCFRSVCGIL